MTGRLSGLSLSAASFLDWLSSPVELYWVHSSPGFLPTPPGWVPAGIASWTLLEMSITASSNLSPKFCNHKTRVTQFSYLTSEARGANILKDRTNAIQMLQPGWAITLSSFPVLGSPAARMVSGRADCLDGIMFILKDPLLLKATELPKDSLVEGVTIIVAALMPMAISSSTSAPQKTLQNSTQYSTNSHGSLLTTLILLRLCWMVQLIIRGTANLI